MNALTVALASYLTSAAPLPVSTFVDPPLAQPADTVSLTQEQIDAASATWTALHWRCPHCKKRLEYLEEDDR